MLKWREWRSEYLLTISNVLVTSIWSLRSACRGMVQLWLTCLIQKVSEFTCHVSGRPIKRSRWTPPPAEFSSSVVPEDPSAPPESGRTPGHWCQQRPLWRARPPAASGERYRQSPSGSSLRDADGQEKTTVVVWCILFWGWRRAQRGRIQNMSVEETASILQGLSRSGYML